MSSPVALLDALERVDEGSAEFLSRYVLGEVAADSYVDVMKSYGPDIVRMLVDSERRLRAEAGGAYVNAVSKSADPGDGAAAAQRFTVAIAEAQLLREAVIDELVSFSKGFKSELWNFVSGQEERQVRRDDKGRFTRSVSQTETSDMRTDWARPDDKEAPEKRRKLPSTMNSSVVPGENGKGVNWADQVKDDEAEKQKYERYLYQLKAVDDLQRELRSAFGDDAEGMLDLNLRLMEPGTGEQLTQQVSVGAPMENYAWSPEQKLTGIDYGPSESLSGRDRDMAMGRLAAGSIKGANLKMADPKLIQSLGQAVSGTGNGDNFDDTKLKRFSQATNNWANVVGQVPGQKAAGASAVLRSMSVTADSAEALRDPMTRAAYRLRGTSKTPDKSLVRSVQGEGVSVDEQTFLDGLAGVKRKLVAGESVAEVKARWGPQMKQLQAQGERKVGNDGMVRMVPSPALLEAQRKFEGEVRAAEARGRRGVAPDAKYFEGKDLSPVAASAVERVRRGESGPGVVQAAQRDAAAKWFLDQMITRSGSERDSSKGKIRESGLSAENLSRLVESVASGVGRGFPSEGVMLDASGRVTSQSVGLGEDHYLPFDMAEYKKLNGGSYVRTRLGGGFTGEDMRTLLAGNGRAATVVSGSGVFDIEFDPNLRGGRRYNDKVAKIPEMYERILDEVANGGHYLVDLDAKSMNEVEDALAKDRTLSSANMAARRENLIDQKRTEMMKISAKDMPLIKQRAQELARQMDNPPAEGSPDYEKVMLKARNSVRDERVRELSVNGEGYEVALKTLQRYFPYYVKNVSRRELGEFASTFAPPETKDPRAAKQARSAAGAVSSRGADKWHVKPGGVTASGRQPQVWNDKRKDYAAESRSKRMVAAGVEKPKVPEATAPGNAVGTVSSADVAAAGGGSTPPWSVGPQVTTKKGTVAPDPDNNAVVDDTKNEMKKTAADNWWDMLGGQFSTFGADLDLELDNLLKAVKSEDAFFNSPSPASAARALVLALNGDRAKEVPELLGSSAELRAAVVDEQGVSFLGDAMGMKAIDDPGDRERYKEELRNQLMEIAAKSAFLFGEWSDVNDSDSLSEAFNGSGPVMLPEFQGVSKPTDLDQFVAVEDSDGPPLHGLSAELRWQVFKDTMKGIDPDDDESSAADWALMERTALAAQKLPEQWENALASLPEDRRNPDGYRFALARLSDGGKYPWLAAATQVALENGVQTEPEQLQWLSENGNDAMSQVADAAVAEYSLRARIATLNWGDDPKVRAVSKAAPMIDRSAILAMARKRMGLPPLR